MLIYVNSISAQYQPDGRCAGLKIRYSREGVGSSSGFGTTDLRRRQLAPPLCVRRGASGREWPLRECLGESKPVSETGQDDGPLSPSRPRDTLWLADGTSECACYMATLAGGRHNGVCLLHEDGAADDRGGELRVGLRTRSGTCTAGGVAGGGDRDSWSESSLRMAPFDTDTTKPRGRMGPRMSPRDVESRWQSGQM